MPFAGDGLKEWAHRSRDEFIADVAVAVTSATGLQDARAFKHMDLPAIAGTVKSSAITLGAGSGQICGPDSGYTWRITRLVVGGLTGGTTPDVVNLFKNDSFSRVPMWQFNGNNFGYVFTGLQMTLRSGETFSLQNVGSLAATGQITLTGELDQVPAEMVWKLL